MIASLRGLVTHLGSTSAVIECGGVGMAVVLTPGARDRLRLGEEGALATHLVVREDSLTLYGFADQAEREIFAAALAAAGVGPKLALALVSTLGAEGLVKAVNSEDTGALSTVPGVGRKSAAKLILALNGKLGASLPGGAQGGIQGRAAGAGPGGKPGGSDAATVQAALESLGWSSQEAQAAVAAVLASGDQTADDVTVFAALDDPVPAMLRAALRVLGNRR
jgi:Holliday junction DNA helicase RuvA